MTNWRGYWLERLDEWFRNPEDWGPDTTWPTDLAFFDAMKFVSNLSESVLTELEIGIAEDGEVNFSWDTDTTWIDLGFYGGSRTNSYFARDKRTGNRFRDSNFNPLDGLPIMLELLLDGDAI